MRLLITGASGFIGRHVVALLRQHGVPAWTLGRTPLFSSDDLIHTNCDLLTGEDGPAAVHRIAPSHWLHLAWVTDHAHYQTAPLNAAWVDATLALGQAFADAGGRHVVVAGTCAEYDWAHGWCREDITPLSPATPYGAAKVVTRLRLQELAAARGLRLAWGRIFFPFGAGQSAQRLIPSLVAALQGRRAVFPIQALQQRDFVSVTDVAQAMWTLLQTSAQGCYNISSAAPVRIGELLHTLARLLDADPAPLMATAAMDLQPPGMVAGDNDRLRALGWAEPTPLRDALASMLAATGALPIPEHAQARHGV